MEAVRTNEPVVALTFDDGPDRAATPQVLDALDRYGARGTFFVLGRQASEHPDLIRRMIETGHTVANHTWSHPSLPRLARSERREEIRRGKDAIGAGGSDLLRPPYGHFDLKTWLDVRTLGYRTIVWSDHCEDWRIMDPAVLLERLEAALVPGAILLLHDRLEHFEHPSFADRAPMIEALARLLGRHSASYRFVTVPELLTLGPARRKVRWRSGDDAWLAGLTRASE